MKKRLIVCTTAFVAFNALADPLIADSFEQQTMTFTEVTLNDTGIIWGGNYPSGNNSDCTGVEIAAQDCSHGRDASTTLNAPNDGHAGFSFTKLDADGNDLPASATAWSCVRDNVTGMTWEVKTDSGLHNAADTYTWYNDDNQTNGGHPGYTDEAAACYGYTAGNAATYCNTQAYVARVNQAGLCGHQDWRLPKVETLRNIVNYNRLNPTIDSDYFPKTKNRWYWSSSPNADYTDYAWAVNFSYGRGYYGHGEHNLYVRLVRGGQ